MYYAHYAIYYVVCRPIYEYLVIFNHRSTLRRQTWGVGEQCEVLSGGSSTGGGSGGGGGDGGQWRAATVLEKVVASDHQQVRKRPRVFGSLCVSKGSFYQDRLGTNIGKHSKKVRFLAALAGGAA